MPNAGERDLREVLTRFKKVDPAYLAKADSRARFAEDASKLVQASARAKKHSAASWKT